MPAPGFKNVGLPADQVQRVDEVVSRKPGIRSRNEFVRRAVDDYLAKCEA